MSRPTSGFVFFPIPNKAIGVLLRRFYQMLRFARDRTLHRLFTVSLHPPIQQVLLETPAISQLERNASNLFLTQVLVQRVWRDPEILRRHTQRHHFLLSFHFLPCLSRTNGVFVGSTSPFSLGVFPVFPRY